MSKTDFIFTAMLVAFFVYISIKYTSGIKLVMKNKEGDDDYYRGKKVMKNCIISILIFMLLFFITYATVQIVHITK